MAEIRGDHEEIFRISEILGEDASVLLLLVRCEGAHKNGNYREVTLTAENGKRHDIFTQYFDADTPRECNATLTWMQWSHYLSIHLAMYGRCISILCSSSSVWMDIVSNIRVAYSSSYTATEGLRLSTNHMWFSQGDK